MHWPCSCRWPVSGETWVLSVISPAEHSEYNDPPAALAAAGRGTDVVQQVALVAAAGVPLSSGLLAYSREAPSRRLRLALRRLSGKLERGVPLDEALSERSSGTSAYLRALVAAALRCGRLGDALNRHLYVVRRTRDIRSRVWLNLAYPLLLAAIALVILIILLTWTVPLFATMFSDFGIVLPTPTLWVVNASNVLLLFVPYWHWVLLVLSILAVLVYCIRFLPGREFRTRLWQRAPLIGATARSVALSEFCSLLGLLVESRLPLPEALRLTASALRDPNLAQGSRKLAEQVERGLSPGDEVQRLPQFAGSLAPLFRWTDRPEAFADGLRAAAELYAMRARVQSGVLGTVIQPLMLAGVIMVAGGVCATLFLPMVSLLQSLT